MDKFCYNKPECQRGRSGFILVYYKKRGISYLMNFIKIESRQNNTLKHLFRLARDKKYRRFTNKMLCEGEKMLFEALSSDVRVESIIIKYGSEFDKHLIEKAQNRGALIFVVQKNLFESLSDTQTPQNIIFSVENKKFDKLPQKLESVILLENIQDPGNLGTILRTADAFALSAVILCEGCTDQTSPKVIRSTMGAIFRIPIYKMLISDAVYEMHKRNINVFATCLDCDSISIKDIDLKNNAVIIGNEGKGISKKTLELADKKIIIPMNGKAESLNASIAASIIMWEMCGGL